MHYLLQNQTWLHPHANYVAWFCLAVSLHTTIVHGSPFDEQIQPFLKAYCFDCHEGDQAEAGITLNTYMESDAKTINRDAWLRVLRQVEGKAMPPADADQPTEDEIETLLAWIQDFALKPDCSGEERPGRVTIRRLNREEYNNTVQDLFQITIRPADVFPSDDIGFGFDTVGDVLTIPPVLLERYIDAADQVARAAIASTDIDASPRIPLPGGVLASRGDIDRDFTIDKKGQYVIRITAWGDQAGPEPPLMTISLDGRQKRKTDVPNERGSPVDHEIRTQLDAGTHTVRVNFSNDFYDKSLKKNRDRNLHVGSISIHGPIGVLPEQVPLFHSHFFEEPIPASADEHEQADMFKKLIKPFASRAFRRWATEDELEELAIVFLAARDRGETIERAAQMSIAAMLVSPSFLFRIEESAAPGQIRSLNDFEIASRLSYFLWSSLPDDTLFRAAVRGELHTTEQIISQALRMLQSPKVNALAKNFAGQWLGLRTLDERTPDLKRFPSFDSDLRTAMTQETELFFQHIVQNDRSIMDCLTADYTFVNETLARHYNMSGIDGTSFQKTSLDSSQRGGLLGHASILTVTSNPTRTSPVKRGKWILENLFNAPPPEPPPDVPQLAEANDGPMTGTLRQMMEQHRADPNCASCHKLMDPLGFGLENYNAIGAWRETDEDLAIDASGELPDGRSFSGPAELRSIILEKKDEFRRCFIEKMMTYGLGRGLEYYDACAVERIAAASAAADDRISVIIAELVSSPAFRQRESGVDAP